jgi:hypothetical protein
MTDSNAIAHKFILQQRARGTANQKALAMVQARHQVKGTAADNNLKARRYLERKRAARMAKTMASGGSTTDALNDPTLDQPGHTVADLNARAVKSAEAPPETSTLTESERAVLKIDQGTDRPRPGSLGRGALGPRPKTLPRG